MASCLRAKACTLCPTSQAVARRSGCALRPVSGQRLQRYQHIHRTDVRNGAATTDIAQLADADAGDDDAPVAPAPVDTPLPEGEVGPDARLQGFPSPLDQEMWKMAAPALLTLLMDPLLGMVDTGTSCHLLTSHSRACVVLAIVSVPTRPVVLKPCRVVQGRA